LLYGVSGLFGAIAVGLVVLRIPLVGWVVTAVSLILVGVWTVVLFERLPFEPQAGVRWRDLWKVPMSHLR
jgi:acyl-coenzyme A synthetase/AMP-(fatty) acid ligase